MWNSNSYLMYNWDYLQCSLPNQTSKNKLTNQIQLKKRFYVSHIWCFVCKNVVWLMFYWAFCKNLLVFWIIPLPINVCWNEFMQYKLFIGPDWLLPSIITNSLTNTFKSWVMYLWLKTFQLGIQLFLTPADGSVRGCTRGPPWPKNVVLLMIRIR